MDTKKTPEAINYEKIRVDSYSVLSIKYMKIDTTINEHGTLKLKAILENGDIKDIYSTTDNKTIEVYYDETEKTTLFYGVVTDVEISVELGVYTIELEAKTLSYLMDIKLKLRSFQHISLSTHKLVNLIMKDYLNANYILNIPDEEVKELIIQYEESDWELLKRIASKYNVGLFPVIDDKTIKFTMGIPNQEKELLSDNISSEIKKDVEEYRYMLINNLEDAKEVDYITYKITNYEVLKLGENIKFMGQKFFVFKGEHEIKNGILENTYELRIKNGLRQKRIFNTTVIGSSINGKIIKTQGSQVKIHLNIDKSQDESSAYWFDFSTMSASEDGSGWYCMPEIGDSVKVYFPTKDEDEAFAVSAVSEYKQMATENEDSMGNPDNKYLRTKHNKQVKLTPGGIFISCDSGQAQMNLSNDGTLSISSQKDVNINAKGNIKIQAEKSFLISSTKSINFACDKNGGLNFDSEGQVKELGTKVNNN
ncbi:late control protein D [Clostridium botulinum]|uniref:phage baseplate assembly protein V n=1 Tax=Clostridium botulinum TaxID=1491 RepID=UPI0007732073|nr:phage baseplate assembly protein V [Clostridium botulinum]NFL87637.1 late control protein D [Clostridium botulinum]NFO20299.1 late control protein D [Clostridium botulinum]HBJ1646472.1 late control protein D [Clostridium botulinum]